jgi:D-alanyl-D-alanine carboxypeptidase (penicillin-binding protein 5/6)
MNQTALRDGAYDTLVETPSGLDGWQQLTSAYDMAIFLRAAADQPRFVAYERQPTGTLPWQQINGYGPVTLQNQNEQFLSAVPGALFAKTGFTDAAQHTFVGAIERNGHRLGVVFLRAQRWPVDQWQQATDLMNWGFALPPGTQPIGHLAAAVPGPLTPTQAPTSRPAQASAALLGLGPRHDTGWVVWLIIAGTVTAGLAAWRFGRVLRG